MSSNKIITLSNVIFRIENFLRIERKNLLIWLSKKKKNFDDKKAIVLTGKAIRTGGKFIIERVSSFKSSL